MTILNKLATSLNCRDEVPNQILAQHIVEKKNKSAINELIKNLNDKDKNIQSDCIKVLYEIGKRNPALIAPFAKEFLALLESSNNRLIWGAMTALDAIASENPKEIFSALPKIMNIAEQGSVITRDHYVGILIKLSSIKQFAGKTFPLLIDQLKRCPTNQLPMYAEHAMAIIINSNRNIFVKTLTARLGEVEKESKKKRIEKVIKKIELSSREEATKTR